MLVPAWYSVMRGLLRPGGYWATPVSAAAMGIQGGGMGVLALDFTCRLDARCNGPQVRAIVPRCALQTQRAHRSASDAGRCLKRPVQPRKLSLRDVDKLVDEARTSGQKPYLARPGGVVLKFWADC